MSDYVVDLDGYTFEDVDEVCKDWRRSTARFFPKIGDVLGRLRSRTPSSARGDIPQPWRPLTDEEIDQLPIYSKIQHHEILAEKAYDGDYKVFSRLGTRDRALLRQDGEWRRMEMLEENHLGEAHRLKKIAREHEDGLTP